MHRRLAEPRPVRLVILVGVFALGATGCIKTISPARTFDAYEHKAKDTAESALSAVQTARLGARVGTDGDAFGPYVSVLLSEAEEGASHAHSTFDSVQPPDAHSDELRHRLGTLLTQTDEHLSTLRIAARRGELGRLERLAEPLRPLAQARPVHHRARMKKLLGVTLGILTAIGGFVDIGDIVANSETGARFGMSLAWAVVLGVGGIIVFAEMSGRVAAVSKRATFDLVRERLGARTAFVNLGASFFITMLTLIAEVAGVALAIQLATDVNYLLWIPLVGFLVWLVIWHVKFESMERTFGLMGLAMIVVAVAVWQLHPDWSDLWHQAAHPVVASGEGHATYFYFAIALFGAAMTPYEVFFFSSGAVEEKWNRSDLMLNRVNVYLGFPLGGFLSLALMAAAAIVFNPASIGVDHLSQVGLPTSLALGKIGLALIIVGFFATTFGAALETGLSTGYTVSQYFGWQWGKMVAPRVAARFHLVVLVSVVAAVLVGITAIDPIKVTEYSIVLSAAALPLTYFPIFVVANDPDYMGDKVNSRLTNAIASFYMVVLTVVAVATVPLMIATKAGS